MDAVVERARLSARVLHRTCSARRPHAADPNLEHGAVNGGTAQLFQQLVFRPVTGLGRSETVVEGLYLASASAHPGGGVHGVCGWLAAKAALGEHGGSAGCAAGDLGGPGAGLPGPQLARMRSA